MDNMSDKSKLFSITGIFSNPDDIIHAAEKVQSEGYKNYDVNTPYPLHGMDTAMKLKPSKLGYFALAFGLSGIAIALGFMYWATAIDYPLVVGGKPFFSLPALIPITFEVTVLLASIGTVVTLLFLFFRLPNNSHPLHDTDYMKKVSVDKFGISIEAKDKIFDTDKVKSLLQNLGAMNITEIYYDESFLKDNYKVYTPKFITFLIVIFILMSGVTYITLNVMLYKVPFSWLMNQDKLVPQRATNFFENGSSMRPPVEGTVARNYLPFQYSGNPDQAEAELINPLPETKENLELGKKKFLIYCSPCHGNFAMGDSHLNGQFPNPPSLHSDKVRNWKDGRIYYVITEGQNLMPSYSSQLDRNERWAVILYIRALQRATNAKEEDLK